MFSRESRPRIDTLIGRTVRIEGSLEYAGGLHIDGRVAGDVLSSDPAATLSVGETGVILGQVRARDVTLAGTVRGDIEARGRVVLAATARVEGNVRYGVIEMTLGARILGRMTRIAADGRETTTPGLNEAASVGGGATGGMGAKAAGMAHGGPPATAGATLPSAL